MDRGAWRATIHGVTNNWTQLNATMFCLFQHHGALTESPFNMSYSFLFVPLQLTCLCAPHTLPFSPLLHPFILLMSIILHRATYTSPPPRNLPAAAKLLQWCPTLCDPIDGSPPGSSIHGIFQARVLEWGAITFSERLSY